MLFNFFIIDQGLCIYHYDFVKESSIDEQLLSVSVYNRVTAQNTFQNGLQAIQIQNGQKMNFFIENHYKIMFCAISDTWDNNFLLEKILKKLSVGFVKKYASKLDSNTRSQIDEFRNFDADLSNILRGKDKKRSRGTMAVGIIVGLLTLIGTLILFILILGVFKVLSDMTIVAMGAIIYIYIGLSLSAYISGSVAGISSMGLKNGIIFAIVLLILTIDL